MSAERTSILVLSHLFPNSHHPYLGLFVARQVQALRETHDIRVVAPTRWLPPMTSAWRRERKLPKVGIVDGTTVYRPRALQVPFGAMAAETLALPVALRGVVRSLVRERTFDLIHAHYGLPDGWAAAKLARELRVPLVLTLWGSDALVLPRKIALRSLLSQALRRATSVIAPSREIADRAVELGADADRTSVLMGGVPDGYASVSRTDARAALALSPDVRLIVWIGSLVPVKQPLLAVRAISLVAERCPDVRLVLIGDGHMLPTVRRTVRDAALRAQRQPARGPRLRRRCHLAGGRRCRPEHEQFRRAPVRALGSSRILEHVLRRYQSAESRSFSPQPRAGPWPPTRVPRQSPMRSATSSSWPLTKISRGARSSSC